MDLQLPPGSGNRILAMILCAALAWAYAAAARREPRRTADGIVLEMPLRWVSILSAVFVFGVHVWLWGTLLGDGADRLLPMWLFVGLVGALLVRRTITVRHELRARGLRYSTRFHGAQDIDWWDIGRVDYSRFKETLEIASRGGTVASIPTRMIGFGHLARALLDNLPANAEIDARANALLAQAAGADRLVREPAGC